MNTPEHIKNLTPRYTVYRCRSKTDDSRKGAIHYSHDGDETICGKWILDGNWWIATNNFSGVATCKECRKLLTEGKQ